MTNIQDPTATTAPPQWDSLVDRSAGSPPRRDVGARADRAMPGPERFGLVLDHARADTASGPEPGATLPVPNDAGARAPVMTLNNAGMRLPAVDIGFTAAAPAAVVGLGLGAGGTNSVTGATALRKLRSLFSRTKAFGKPEGVAARPEPGDRRMRRTGGLDLGRLTRSPPPGAVSSAPGSNESAGPVQRAGGQGTAGGLGQSRDGDAKTLSEIDKTLADIDALIAKCGDNGGNSAEVAELRGLRRDLAVMGLSLRVEGFNRLRDRVRGEIADITTRPEAAIRASPRRWAADRDGVIAARSKILADIEPALGDIARLIHQHQDDGLHELGELRTLQHELTGMALAAQFDFDAEQATKSLVAIQAGADARPVPVAAMIRAMGTAVPSLNEWAHSADPTKQRAAAASVATLAMMIEDGEHLDFVLGRDGSLNTAFLPVREAFAERCAVAVLTDKHRREGKSPPTEEEEGAVRGQARDAAALRLELSIANRQLEQLLETDRRVMHRPSTWGEKGAALGDGSASVLRKDAAFIQARRRRGGGAAGRDMALLVARISDLERRTLPLEKNVLGLHRNFDLAQLGAPDPEHPLAHVGITNADLAAMGLDGVARARLTDQAIKLNRQGLAGVDDVVAANRALHGAAHSVFRSTQSQDTIRSFAQDREPVRPQRLLDDRLADAVGTHSPVEAGRGQAAVSPHGRAAVAGGQSPAAANLRSRTGEMMLNRGAMDDRTTRALLAVIEGLQSGESVNLKSGQRITLDSGKIPVDVTGLLGLRARLAAAGLGECEIERGSDGDRLHVRTGREGKANLDFIAGQKFGLFGKFEAGVGAEGSHARLGGATFTFANDDNGRQALIALVDKMSSGNHIGPADWADAKDVAMSQANATKAGLGARGNVRGEFTAAPNHSVDKQGVGLSLEATATASGSVTSTEFASLNERTHKGSLEVSASIGASASFYAQLYSAANAATGIPMRGGPQDRVNERLGTQNAAPGGSPNYNMSSGTANTDLLGASVSTTATYTKKWKQVTDPDNRFTKAEIVRQTNVKAGAVSAISVVVTDDLRRRIQENAEFARNIGALMGLMKSDDSLAVSYGLRPDRLRHANALIDEAKALRSQGSPERAGALQQRAQATVDDEASYEPAKISLITAATDKQQMTNLNMRFIRWDTYADGKSEHPALVLAVP